MPISDPLLLALLQALEVELHQPAARGDANRLGALLHDDFREVGRSGSQYTRPDILSRLPPEAQPAAIVADRFALRRLGADVALLTYRSAHRLADGSLDRYTLRASFWERSAQGWQMSFHQGTPTTFHEPGEP